MRLVLSVALLLPLAACGDAVAPVALADATITQSVDFDEPCDAVGCHGSGFLTVEGDQFAYTEYRSGAPGAAEATGPLPPHLADALADALAQADFGGLKPSGFIECGTGLSSLTVSAGPERTYQVLTYSGGLDVDAFAVRTYGRRVQTLRPLYATLAGVRAHARAQLDR